MVLQLHAHLIVLASLPIYALLSVAITPAIRTRLHDKFNRGAENQAFLVEAVSGVQTVKALAVEPPLLRNGRNSWRDMCGRARATSLITVAGHSATCVQKVTTVAVLWVGVSSDRWRSPALGS
ncbi:MAG: ABC transporter transmembrane domain-containing protein [Nitrospira sp.]